MLLIFDQVDGISGTSPQAECMGAAVGPGHDQKLHLLCNIIQKPL